MPDGCRRYDLPAVLVHLRRKELAAAMAGRTQAQWRAQTLIEALEELEASRA